MSFNKIIIVGNIGKDPELRYTPQGVAVCNFNLATNARRGDQEDTTWFKVTLWRQMAENAAKYLTRGMQVYIEGRLRVETYQNREGETHYTLEVSATDMQFIGNNKSSSSDGGGDDAPNVNDDLTHTGGPSSFAEFHKKDAEMSGKPTSVRDILMGGDASDDILF